MQKVIRGRNIFYIKDYSVIVGLNGGFQYTAYTVYPLQNRKPFYDFKKEIEDSKADELCHAVDIIKLAQKYNLIGVGSHKPVEIEKQ